MAIPRRLIVVAASAAAAGVLWYVAKRSQAQGGRSAVDDANDEKEKAEAEQKKKADASAPNDANGSKDAAEPKKAEPGTTGVDGARKELALFLSGDAWHDEIGWQALWEKDGVPAPDAWLRQTGREVLLVERQKLTDSPALLAGCRRRWIVVCRYAGIDVGEAATLWNDA
jgi:hypothetical protein